MRKLLGLTRHTTELIGCNCSNQYCATNIIIMKHRETYKLKKKKVLKYYNRFFKDDITLSDIASISKLSFETVYQILMDKYTKDKEKAARKRKEALEDFDENDNYTKAKEKGFRDTTFETKTVDPIKIEELNNNKVRVTYPSKMNNYGK